MKSKDERNIERRRLGRYRDRVRRKLGFKKVTPAVRAAKRKAAKKHKKKHPERIRAWKRHSSRTLKTDLWIAGKRKLSKRSRISIRPLFCSTCGASAEKIEMVKHHPDDYTPDRDTMWICRRCHVDLHVYCKDAEEVGLDPREGLKKFLCERGYLKIMKKNK